MNKKNENVITRRVVNEYRDRIVFCNDCNGMPTSISYTVCVWLSLQRNYVKQLLPGQVIPHHVSRTQFMRHNSEWVDTKLAFAWCLSGDILCVCTRVCQERMCAFASLPFLFILRGVVILSTDAKHIHILASPLTAKSRLLLRAKDTIYFRTAAAANNISKSDDCSFWAIATT